MTGENNEGKKYNKAKRDLFCYECDKKFFFHLPFVIDSLFGPKLDSVHPSLSLFWTANRLTTREISLFQLEFDRTAKPEKLAAHRIDSIEQKCALVDLLIYAEWDNRREATCTGHAPSAKNSDKFKRARKSGFEK